MPRKKQIIAGDPDEIGQLGKNNKSTQNISKGRFWQIALIVGAFFSLVSFALMAYFYNRQHNELISLRLGQVSLDSKKEELKQIIAEAAKRTDLPKELPIAGQILDDKNINNWPFLNQAKAGDWVLIYPKGVYVYRVSSQQLVATVDVQFGASTLEAKKESIRLAIRNGGVRQGAASDMADQLKTLTGYSIVDIGNAANDAYVGNLIYNPLGKSIEDLLIKSNAVVTSSLPLEEASTTADVLLIIGN